MDVKDEVIIYFIGMQSDTDTGGGVFTANKSFCGVEKCFFGEGLSGIGTTNGL